MPILSRSIYSAPKHSTMASDERSAAPRLRVPTNTTSKSTLANAPTTAFPTTLNRQFPINVPANAFPKRKSYSGLMPYRFASYNSTPDLSSSSGSSSDSLLFSDISSPELTDAESDSSSSPSPTADHPVAVDVTKTKLPFAMTKLLTTESDLAQRKGRKNSSGVQLIQKYCCGGGCCFSPNEPPTPLTPSLRPFKLPDNDAFRSLGLDLPPLDVTTELTDITPLPEKNVSFSPIPPAQQPKRSVFSGKQPPSFVQPHPPYDVFSAPLYHARVLTKPGAEKKTFHFDIDVTDYPEEGGVDFKTGGAIGVTPANYPEAVEDIFNALGVPKFIRDKPVTLNTKNGRWPTVWGDEKPRSLTATRRQILTWCTDVQSYPPTKQLLRLMAEHATAPNEKKILMYLVSQQGQGTFCDLRTGPHLSISQLLHAFPSSKPPLDDVLSTLSQLMPRFYSLSNDPHVSSERDGLAGRRLVEVAVTIHSRPNWRGGSHHGVGSGFLERLAKQFIAAEEAALARGLSVLEAHEEARKLDIRVPMFRGLMANPLSKEFGNSNGPMMLVGAGVGMAPFRGFILNRLRNANCASKIWLVQGVRDSSVDELYSGELGQYEGQIKKVVQSRARRRLEREDRRHSESDLVRTGRDAENEQWKRDPEKESKYVQDELRHQADIVWDVIRHEDGRIFVCGSSKGMGEGVEQALRDVAMSKGGFNLEGATRFWAEQKEAGKYIAETW